MSLSFLVILTNILSGAIAAVHSFPAVLSTEELAVINLVNTNYSFSFV